jgi:hypothetical protein
VVPTRPLCLFCSHLATRVRTFTCCERFTKDSHHETSRQWYSSPHSANKSPFSARCNQSAPLNLPPWPGAAIGGRSRLRLQGRPTIGYLLWDSRALEMDDGCLRWAQTGHSRGGHSIRYSWVRVSWWETSDRLSQQSRVKLAEPKARVGGPTGGRLQPPQPGPLLAWYPWCPALLPAAWCSPAAIRTALPGSVLDVVPCGNYVYHTIVMLLTGHSAHTVFNFTNGDAMCVFGGKTRHLNRFVGKHNIGGETGVFSWK